VIDIDALKRITAEHPDSAHVAVPVSFLREIEQLLGDMPGQVGLQMSAGEGVGRVGGEQHA
jgi:hypothetical protein